MERVDITIVGAGFAGAIVAVQLARRAPQTRVLLCDGDGGGGRGVAYGTSSDRHLLNVPAGKMSAFPDDPDHFWQWVNARHAGVPVEKTAFMPRKVYGEYVQSLLAEARVASPKLRVAQARIIEIEPHRPSLELADTQGNRFVSTSVVLALGNYPPADLRALDDAARSSRSYLRSPWEKNSLSRIGQNDDVLIVGSGLTAIDVLLSLEQQGAKGKMHMVSRHGLLPLPHRQYDASRSYFNERDLPKSIREMTSLVRREARDATARGEDWRGVVDALRPRTQAYWQSLPHTERRRFLRHVRPYWEAHRHRLAPEVASVVNRLTASGQLQRHHGRFTSIARSDDRFEVNLTERSSALPISFTADFVVNCTGPESNYGRLRDPLVAKLVADGMIAVDSLGMGIKCDADGAVIDSSGRVSVNLFTIGIPRKGELYETTAVPEIRAQAHDLARRLTAAIR